MLDDAAALVDSAVQAEVDTALDDATGGGERAASRRDAIAERGGIAAMRSDAVIAILTGGGSGRTALAPDVVMAVDEAHHRDHHSPAARQCGDSDGQRARENRTPSVSAEAGGVAEGGAGVGVSAEAPSSAESRGSAAVRRDAPAPAVGGRCGEAPGGGCSPAFESSTPTTSGTPPAVDELLGHDPFRATLDGHLVATSVAERLCCDPRIVPMLEDAARSPVGVGRKTRLISRRLRRALERRDGGRCQFPGCFASRGLHAHHIVHWSHGGPTELWNLILVCHFHHHLVHEGGWAIEIATRRFRRPDEGQPVEGSPYMARFRGSAELISTHTMQAHSATGDSPLEPPNLDPLDLAWATAILHHNESVRRHEAASAT